MRRWSIRSLLVILVLACSLPLVAVLAWSTYQDYRVSAERAEAGLISLAEVTAGDLQRFLDDAEAILSSVSERPWIMALDPGDCGPLFGEARNLLPRFTNLAVWNVSGLLVCSTLLQDPSDRIQVADRYWYQTVKRTEAFTIGKPLVGRVTGAWLTMLAYPLHTADGSLAGIVSLSVDLERFHEVLGDAALPPGGVISLFDADGTIVARSSMASEFVGKKLGDAVTGELHGSIGTGVSRSTGIEGIDRVWGFVTLPGEEWRVYVGVPTDWIYAPLRAAAYRGTFLSLVILLLVGGLTWGIYRHIARALKALVAGTQAVADGQEAHYLGDGPVEVVHVGEQFARMVRARDEAEKVYLQAQRMDALGRLAGGVAHDINNMLTTILGNTELVLEDEPLGGAARESLEQVQEAAVRSARLTRQLLTMAGRDIAQPEPLDLGALVTELAPMLQRVIGANIELVTLVGAEAMWALTDLSQMEQVLLNLVNNAQEAIVDRGKITVELSRDREEVLLRVSDDGVGMDEATRARIFEPFFTTKELGTGLGLATVYGIVTDGGGSLACSSELGKGTTFVLRFPACAPSTVVGAGPAPARPRAQIYRSVLLVEDEPAVRSMTRRLLEGMGCLVVDAENGEEALRAFVADPHAFDVLLTDLVMPMMGGKDLAKAVTRIRPEIPVVFMSGYADEADARRRLQGSRNFLQKPFKKVDMEGVLTQVSRDRVPTSLPHR